MSLALAAITAIAVAGTPVPTDVPEPESEARTPSVQASFAGGAAGVDFDASAPNVQNFVGSVYEQDGQGLRCVAQVVIHVHGKSPANEAMKQLIAELGYSNQDREDLMKLDVVFSGAASAFGAHLNRCDHIPAQPPTHEAMPTVFERGSVFAGINPLDPVGDNQKAKGASRARARIVSLHTISSDDANCNIFVRTETDTGEVSVARGGPVPPGVEKKHVAGTPAVPMTCVFLQFVSADGLTFAEADATVTERGDAEAEAEIEDERVAAGCS